MMMKRVEKKRTVIKILIILIRPKTEQDDSPIFFSLAISPLSQVLDVEAAIQQRKSEVKNFLHISTQCFSVKINVSLKIYFSPGGEADTGDEDCQP